MYVVTAFPNAGAKVAAAVYGLDANGGALRLISSVSDPQRGIEAVSMDYEGRVVVISAPAITPSVAYVLNMDSPQHLRSVDIGFAHAFSALSEHIIWGADGSPELALILADDETPYLFGIDLSTLRTNDEKLHKLQWAAFAGVRVFGSAGVGQSWPDTVQVRVGTDGGVVLVVGETRVQGFDIQAPAALRGPTDDPVWLNANNEDLAMLSPSALRTPNPAGLGFHTDYVYSRIRKHWDAVKIPGSASLARVSGPWLLYVVAEPSKTQLSPGKQISSSGMYFPGKLFAYDSRSGQSYMLETAQGDTEPLVIDGETLYYRVNDSIYMATIGKGSIQNPTCVATDAVLSEAHWAFVGQ